MRRRKGGPSLLVAVLSVQAIFVRTTHPTPEEQLIKRIEELGGIVHMRPDQPCDTCLRGAVATKDIAPADVILRIPAQALVHFPHFDHPVFAAVSICLSCSVPLKNQCHINILTHPTTFSLRNMPGCFSHKYIRIRPSMRLTQTTS